LQAIFTDKSSPANSLNGVTPPSAGSSFKMNNIHQEMETPNSFTQGDGIMRFTPLFLYISLTSGSHKNKKQLN